MLVAVLGDPEEPDAVPARPDVGDRAEVVRHGGIVPARRVGVSARLEDEEREERRRPDRQAAPDEDLDGRIARGDASGQVARLGAWLPKPLTRAHNGRIIRAWSSGTSRLRRRTRRSWRCDRSRRSWLGTGARSSSSRSGSRRLTTRIAGNGGNVEPHELEEVQRAVRRGGRRHRAVCRADPRAGRARQGPRCRPRRLSRDPRRTGGAALLAPGRGRDRVLARPGRGLLGPQASLASRSEPPRPHPGGDEKFHPPPASSVSPNVRRRCADSAPTSAREPQSLRIARLPVE